MIGPDKDSNDNPLSNNSYWTRQRLSTTGACATDEILRDSRQLATAQRFIEIDYERAKIRWTDGCQKNRSSRGDEVGVTFADLACIQSLPVELELLSVRRSMEARGALRDRRDESKSAIR